jgi:hypothetical protein
MRRTIASGLPNFVDGGIELFLGASDQRHTGAVLGEPMSNGEIDPAAAPRDERILASEQLLPEYFRHVDSSWTTGRVPREWQTYPGQ